MNSDNRRQINTFAKRLGLITAILFVSVIAVAGQRRERLIDGWKPVHYDLDLTFNDQLTELTAAKASISVEVLRAGLRTIDFDFGELPVDSVQISGTRAEFKRSPGRLEVILAQAAKRGRLNVTINYHGRPKDGLIFASDKDGNLSATGDNWPDRVHHWVPVLDHPAAKATVSFTIAAPQSYQVIANGKLAGVSPDATNSVWRFAESKPIPPYCIVVTVNQGVILKSPEATVTELIYNVPHADKQYAIQGFAAAAPSLAFFSQTVAPYPYEKLALIVAATRFGGMENSSAIVFSNTLFNNLNNQKMSARFGIPSHIEEIVAHEIAHQWFGDSVTELTWADLWLSEGFATYFAGLFVEKHDGEAAFREYMRGKAESYIRYEKQQSKPLHDTSTADLMQLLNPNNYEKGAWVLHILRSQLGDQAFFKGVRNYYLAHREANASSEDLRKALEAASGKNLKSFFARWVYGAGHPRYELRWEMMRGRAGQRPVKITLTQLQSGALFPDPVPVEIVVNGDKIRKVIYPKSKFATLIVPANGKPSAVQIDPDESLLKEVKAN
jgi:aminopeptidase N